MFQRLCNRFQRLCMYVLKASDANNSKEMQYSLLQINTLQSQKSLTVFKISELSQNLPGICAEKHARFCKHTTIPKT